MTQTETTETEPQPDSEHAPPARTVPDEIAVPDKATLVAWLSGDDISDDDESDDLVYEQALKILQAEDEAAVLARDQVVKVADLVGSTFTVLGVSWRKSTKSEDGKGRYALMRCVDKDGGQFLASCGATKVVLQLRKAEWQGWFPWTVEMSSEATSNNRTIFELVAPSADF